MTDINLTVPLQRRSPLYIPRRDLALAATDSLSLLVTLVEADDPSAPPAVLPGASVTLTVWADPWPCYWGSWGYGCGWDYGHGEVGGVLWSEVEGLSSGSVAEFFLPIATMSGWPLRTIWALSVEFSGTSTMISTGRLHLTCSMVNTTGAGVGSPLILDVDPDGHMDSKYHV